VTDNRSPIRPIPDEPDLMVELRHREAEWETADSDSSRDAARRRFLNIFYFIMNRQEPITHVTTETALSASGTR
jgi:hypothetical protein